jgi:hypothetical protein
VVGFSGGNLQMDKGVRRPEEIAKENSGISFMDVRRQEPPKRNASEPLKTPW